MYMKIPSRCIHSWSKVEVIQIYIKKKMTNYSVSVKQKATHQGTAVIRSDTGESKKQSVNPKLYNRGYPF